MRFAAVAAVLFTFVACKKQEPQPRQQTGSGSGSAGLAAPKLRNTVSRADFNRLAMQLDLPVYWIADANSNKTLDPDEFATVLFHAGQAPTLDAAWDQIATAAVAPPLDTSTEDGKRRALVRGDLMAGRPTLLVNDFTSAPAQDKAFVKQMLVVSDLIDKLYSRTTGAEAVASKVAPDPESQSLFRRNHGIDCVGPVTSKDPACSAVPGAPKPIYDIYPAELQKDDFCKDFEARKDHEALLGHFNVVRGSGDKLAAVPYTTAYAELTNPISDALAAAAAIITDPKEAALVAYLNAAAASFKSNDWVPADEAWSKMSVDNSNWYVRVGPDETYWEPCASKAGFHLTFAKINQGSRAWQSKLVPVQQEMEDLIATKAGAPYKVRKVTFHLPDFIDIIVNSGQDRAALGATIGQSLPNWGPVVAEGRGRTVAMININTDPDSRDARKSQMESLFDADSAKLYPASTEPGLLSTILHEATHNLGPAHEYKVNGKIDDEAFTGPIAAMMEELKAQTGALFLLDFVRSKNLITQDMANQSFVDSIVWAFGHISQGMYTGEKQRKAYGNLAAIQIGYLIDKGALTWDATKPAANGTDKGAFTVHADKLSAAAAEMMKEFAGIKARGDKAAAEKWIARYVDSDTVVPHKLVAERFLRQSKPSYLYSVRQ